MSRILIITFFLLISLNAFAENYLIMNNLYKFEDFQQVQISNCSDNCEAKKNIKKFRKSDLAKLTRSNSYQNSVGSEVCEHIFKGASLLGLARNKDRRAFCVFKDESLIEINSLSTKIKSNNW